MQSSLPSWLSEASERALFGVSGKALAAEYARLSEAYRLGKPSQPSGEARLFWLAYLAGRLPATYAAVQAALRQVPAELVAGCESLLDLGSGPGTATWAAAAYHPGLTRALAVEKSLEAIALGRQLAESAPLKPEFIRGELPGAAASAAEADLVIVAYAAAETGPALLEAAFARARKLLLVVEPGTPAGFKMILEARRKLPGLVAPCPQAGECPMAAAPEIKWCHFSARLERNRLAKLLKGGELGYEDEKFSYAAFSKLPAGLAHARVLGHPKKAGNAFALELCEASGLRTLSLPKHDKAAFKAARKAEWGDPWL